MKKATAILALAGTLAFAGSSAAAPSACTPGLASTDYVQFYDGVGSPGAGGDGTVDNLGGAISGGFYGNTSNAGTDSDAPDNNNGVTPSISPGPQVVGGGGPGTGTSLGAFLGSDFCQPD